MYRVALKLLISLCLGMLLGCGGNTVKPSFSKDVRIPTKKPGEIVLNITPAVGNNEVGPLIGFIRKSLASNLGIPIVDRCSRLSCWVLDGRVKLKQNIERVLYNQAHVMVVADGISRIDFDFELKEMGSSPFFSLSFGQNTEVTLTGPMTYLVEKTSTLSHKIGPAVAEVITSLTIAPSGITGGWKNPFSGETVNVGGSQGKFEFVGMEDEIVERNGVRAKLGEVERFRIRGNVETAGNMHVFKGRLLTDDAVGTNPVWRGATYRLLGKTLIVDYIGGSLIYIRS